MHRVEQCMNRHSPGQALFAELFPDQNAGASLENELKTLSWFLSLPE